MHDLGAVLLESFDIGERHAYEPDCWPLWLLEAWAGGTPALPGGATWSSMP